MWLLDTNACIALLNGSSKPLAERLAKERPSQVRLCAVVKAELLFGARNSECVADNLRLLDAFFERFVSVPFDDACAVEYGRIRADLQRTGDLGDLIAPNDLMVVAIAVAGELTLVTHDVREFSRVEALAVEDWL